MSTYLLIRVLLLLSLAATVWWLLRPVSSASSLALRRIGIGFLVAGAIVAISIESVVGFGNMNATAEAAAMRAKGISDRHFSRANDRRRGGFVEAEGGGFVMEFADFIEAGIPVLTAVAARHQSGWQRFTGGLHAALPADEEALVAWCRAQLARRKREGALKV